VQHPGPHGRRRGHHGDPVGVPVRRRPRAGAPRGRVASAAGPNRTAFPLATAANLAGRHFERQSQVLTRALCQSQENPANARQVGDPLV